MADPTVQPLPEVFRGMEEREQAKNYLYLG
jgi:hypothetical protein